jgi:WD40 repeat protein
VRAVAFSPDGKTILTGSDDGSARLWDAAINQTIGQALLHQGPVVAVAFSPDGKTLLTVSSDSTVRLWDANPGQPSGLILENDRLGAHAAFSPDGKSILSGVRRDTETVTHWDAATGLPIGPPMHHRGAETVPAVAYSPDGRILLTSGNALQRWDAATGKPIDSPLSHHDQVDVVAFSPDGKIIMTASQDGTIVLWDAVTGAPLGEPIPQPGSVDAVTFSPDGRSFATGLDVGSVQLWDVASRTPLGKPFPHPGAVSAVAYSPDGKALLTGCEDSAARLWDLESRTLLVPPLRHQGWVFAVAYSPDGESLLTGSRDQTARLWDAATGMALGPPLLHPHQVLSVAYSPDGKSILTGCSDGAARLFLRPSELPDDLERVATCVEVLTGLTLDARHGSIGVLDNASWRERRERMDRLGGPPVIGSEQRLDPFPFGTDPTARPRALMQRGRWDSVDASLDEVVRARPYSVSAWLERGKFHITRGHPEKAAADLAAAIRLRPEDLRIQYDYVLSLLALGDQASLQRTCSELLDRFGTTSDPHIANTGAWCCVLGQDAVADLEAPVRLAEFAVKNVDEARKADYLNTLGAAMYRAGHIEEAIRCLEEGIRKRGGEGSPEDWVFLALAHHRLGHRAESRRWLDRLRDPRTSERTRRWEDELEIQVLHSEAEAVILYDPIFPADPFTH